MALSKPYSSLEVANVVERWQPCEFAVKDTNKNIISISYYDIFKPGSVGRCNPVGVERIKVALKKAYDEGVREVTLRCSKPLQDELIVAALSIVDDPNWKIYPLYQLAYLQGVVETKEKIWTEALRNAELDAEIEQLEKALCEAKGFTDEVIDELLQYQDVKDFNELPEHLQKLFAEGQK